MTDHSGDLAPETERSEPLYQRATTADVEKVNFDEVIKGIPSADCREYQGSFVTATERAKSEGNESAASVYAALSALCGLHFRPGDVNDPFGPMIQIEGRRSAIPSDFRSSASAVAMMAERTSDVALKARLSDVAWLLDRRRVDLGLAAISAYCQTVRDVAAGARKFRLDQSNTPYSAQSRNLLKRAMSLAVMRSVGLGKPEEKDVRSLVKQLFVDVLTGSNLRDVQRFADLALQYGIIPPLDIGSSCEDWLRRSNVADGHDRVDLLVLAATAYHKGGSMPDHYRCRLEAADTRVRMSQAGNLAMISASLLAEAISELHGIPDVKERRRELRHQLIDVQANISDELTSFSQEIDLKEIVKAREASFQGLCLRDMLFYFADMSQSPTPEQLRAEAQQSINDNPLSSILSTSFHDRDGKVSYRSENVDLMSAPTDEALRSTVAEAERIRRQIFAEGDIQTARRLINESYYVTEEIFVALLRDSNFVPAELLRTYGRGFQRFFQGDPVSGLYILTPLLEASIRHVLKGRGYDVSTFDNATKTQQDLTISAMFDQMKTELLEVFGPAFVADIENVFLDQPGPTIRHQIAHGLMTDGNPYGPDSAYACWLIFRLCLITLFPHRENIDENLWQ
ncbi:DUF7380 domain-containing protein [Rhizobium leguminosarum]